MKKLFAILLVLCSASLYAGTVTLNVTDHSGSALAGVKVSYNDYGTHYATLGTTNASGQVVATVPNGTWDYKATKNHTSSIVSGSSPGTINFQTSKFVVHVVDHTNSNLSGVAASFNDYGTHYLSMGNTDANGKASIELFAGTRKFKATKNHTSTTGDLTISTAGTTGTIKFQTSKFIVHVVDHANSNLSGVAASFNDYGTHYLSMGNTDANGKASIELFAGTRKFKATKNHTSTTGDLIISTAGTTGTIKFQTSKFIVHVVDHANSNLSGVAASFNDYGTHYLSMGNTDANGKASIELFAGTRKFKATKNHTSTTGDLTISTAGTTGTIKFQTSKFIVHVVDHANNNLPGVAASFNDYGTHYLSIGNTDAGGKASIELFAGTRKFKATKNHTSTTGDLTIGSGGTTGTIKFQTAKALVSVQDCDGSPIKDVSVSFNDYGSHWLSIGKTDASGNSSIQLFAGTRKFKATTDHTSKEMTMNLVLLQTQIIFNPTQVNFQYAGTIKFNDYGSHWKTMTNSFYLFPGTYNFRFGTFQTSIVISGCKIEKSAIQVRLINSLGNGIAGGDASYYKSGWNLLGTTNTSGDVFALLDGPLGKLSFRMKHAGATQTKKQDVAVDPVVVFQTELVSMQLQSSTGAVLSGGTEYYASGWKTFGSGNSTTTMELLPLKYHFRMKYAGSSNTKKQDVGVDPLVLFKTELITMELQSSTGVVLTGGTEYYASGWKTFGSGSSTTTMELLPNKYHFRMKYAGSSNTKKQDVGVDPLVLFKTELITMELQSSTGAVLTGGTEYYASGWKTFGSGSSTTTMELLPNKYHFRMKYAGSSNTKKQDVGANPLVLFKTELISMQLKSSTGATLNGGTEYYASGWKTFGSGTSTATMELLPNKYHFRMKYAGSSNTKKQDVGIDPIVIFTTTKVTMKLLDNSGNQLAGTSSYYGSGWKTFGSGTTTTTMELLPNKYHFRVAFGGGKLTKKQDIGIDPIVIFTGTEVTIHFTGNVQYYASGWKTFTTPTMTLLPGNYTFKFSGTGYGARTAKILVTGNKVEKTVAYVSLFKSNGKHLGGGTAQYYLSGWKSISGTTSGSGGVIHVFDGLMSSNLPFRMSYAGSSNQKSQQVNVNSFVDFQTELVSMELKSSAGTKLTGGTQYYASGWKTFGSGTSTTKMELLPNTYPFRMSYAGGSNQKNQDVGVDPNVVFETELISMELKSSTGATLSGGTQYYASGWKTFGSGTSTTSMELLPNTYPFRMSYAGASNQKNQDVAANPNVVFETELISMELKSSAGATLAGGTQYYASGWKTFGSGTSTTTMELLPNTYPFRMSYAGGSNQKNQDVAANPNVLFTTKSVTMKLLDGATELAGTSTYYASGWKSFGSGTTTTSMELLPQNLPFKVVYNGTSYQKNQDIGVNSLVEFTYIPPPPAPAPEEEGDGDLTGNEIDNNTDISNNRNITRTENGTADQEEADKTVTPTVAKQNVQSDTKPANSTVGVIGSSKAYPNPFGASVNIEFTISAKQNVTIAIYDMSGAIVKTLGNKTFDQGKHTVNWNSSNNAGNTVAAGVYLVKFITSDGTYQHKVTKLK